MRPLELPAAGFCSAWLTSLVGYNGELPPQVTHGPILSSFFPGPKAGLLPCVGQSERHTVQCWPACLRPGPGLLQELRGALCWSGGFWAEEGNLEMKTGRWNVKEVPFQSWKEGRGSGPLARATRGCSGNTPAGSPPFSVRCQPCWGEADLSLIVSVDQLEEFSSPVDWEGR